MSRYARVVVGTLIFAALAFVLPGGAEAVLIKSLQTGTTSFSGTAQRIITLGTTVTSSSAFVLCTNTDSNATAATGSQSNRLVSCSLNTAGTQVTLTAGTTAGATDVARYYVVEFDSAAGGVSVQRGSASMTTGTRLNVTLGTAVTCSKSFVLWSSRITLASTTQDDRMLAYSLLSTSSSAETNAQACNSGTTTNLNFSRATGTTTTNIEWQVVQMDDASVTRGVATMSATTSTTIALSGVSTATAKTFPLITRSVSGAAGQEDKQNIRADLSAANLTLTRKTGTTSTALVSYEIVTLNDGSLVQSKQSVTVTSNTLLHTTTAFTTDLTNSVSVPFFTVSGGSAGQTAELNRTSWMNAQVNTNATPGLSTVTMSRGLVNQASTDAVTFSLFVVNFPSCGTATANPTKFSVTSGSGVNPALTWTSAHNVLVLAKTSAFVGADTPVKGTTYSVGASSGPNGTQVLATNSSAGSVSDTLSAGNKKYYKVYSQTGTGASTCYSGGGAATESTVWTADGTSLRWSYGLAGGAALSAPSPDYDNDRVVLPSNSSSVVTLIADGPNASANRGKEAYTPLSASGAVQGYPVWFPASDGTNMIVFTDMNSTSPGPSVYAMNTANGAQLWKRDLGTLLNSPATLVATPSVQLRAFSNSAFTTAFPGTYDVIFVGTNPTAGASTDTQVFALRSDTGAVLWNFNLASNPATKKGNMDRVQAQPAVDYATNTLWVPSRSNGGGQQSLWPLSTLDGSRNTGVNFLLTDVTTAPSISFDGSKVYVGNQSTSGAVNLYAINTANQTQAWAFALGNGESVTSYVMEDYQNPGTLYFVSDASPTEKVYCITDNGSGASLCNVSGTNWTTPTIAGATSVIMIDSGTSRGVYVNSTLSNGSVKKITPYTPGVSLGSGAAGNPGISTFQLGDNTAKVPGDLSVGGNATDLFIGTDEGRLYKLNLPSALP